MTQDPRLVRSHSVREMVQCGICQQSGSPVLCAAHLHLGAPLSTLPACGTVDTTQEEQWGVEARLQLAVQWKNS